MTIKVHEIIMDLNMSKKLLFLIPLFSVLLFSCNENTDSKEEESTSACSCTCTCEQSSESSEETSESSASSEESTSFIVKFSVNTEKLDNWNPPAGGYFIHAWGSQGGFDTWGEATMNIDSAHNYSYSYTIDNGKAITGVILAFYQSDALKQTIDINCNISSAGEYIIQYDDASWTSDYKMNASLVPVE